jgi:hypothetical protein
MIRQYEDGRTSVTSPAVDVDSTFNKDSMKVGMGYAQDILTSASADVRTFGSKGVNSKINENRVEFQGNFEARIPDGTLGGGYIQSDEHDYHSRVVSAAGTRELFQKNTVLGLGFSNGEDTINSAAEQSFNESMNHQVYTLSVSQVLSKESLLQLISDFRVENGYLASPYRKAKIDAGDGSPITARAENHPRTRNRNAFALKYNVYFRSLELSAATAYRYYRDTWDVQSHTIEERFSKDLGPHLSLSLSLRYYTQTQASFYKDYYSSDPGSFYTGNATLSTYHSYLIGVRPAWNVSDHVSLYLRFEYYAEDFDNASDAGSLSTRSDDVPLQIRAQVYGFGLTGRF